VACPRELLGENCQGKCRQQQEKGGYEGFAGFHGGKFPSGALPIKFLNGRGTGSQKKGHPEKYFLLILPFPCCLIVKNRAVPHISWKVRWRRWIYP
jgi:hypothetical protein